MSGPKVGRGSGRVGSPSVNRRPGLVLVYARLDTSIYIRLTSLNLTSPA